MFLVQDILSTAKNIVGVCDQTTFYQRLTEAVELGANKGQIDLLTGSLDVNLTDLTAVLPQEVQTILAVNHDGIPSVGQDRFFNFHVNGPGDRNCRSSCRWFWRPGEESATFKDLTVPSRLIAFADVAEDEDTELWAYGLDVAGNWIKTRNEDGELVDGYKVPVVFGLGLPDPDAPLFAAAGIKRTWKGVTQSFIRVEAYEDAAVVGTMIATYQANETVPQYRRISVSEVPKNQTIRIAYRRRLFELRAPTDPIPLNNRLAFFMFLRAVVNYGKEDLALATGFEATGARMLSEEEDSLQSPVSSPVQVDPAGQLHNKCDDVD